MLQFIVSCLFKKERSQKMHCYTNRPLRFRRKQIPVIYRKKNQYTLASPPWQEDLCHLQNAYKPGEEACLLNFEGKGTTIRIRR